MRFLTLAEVLRLHSLVVAQSGGADGVRDLRQLESAIAQPRVTFDGEDLYPGIVEKAAVLGFTLIQGHPFIDGNKRIGHAALEVFLKLNGFALSADVDDQERLILGVASGNVSLEELTEWLQHHAKAAGA